MVVQDLKKQPLQEVPKRVEEIWQEFLAPGAQSAINLDSHSFEKTSQNVKDAGRYTFEDAQVRNFYYYSNSYSSTCTCNLYESHTKQFLPGINSWKPIGKPEVTCVCAV